MNRFFKTFCLALSFAFIAPRAHAMENLSCLACMDEKPAAQFYTLTCGHHPYCNECFYRPLAQALAAHKRDGLVCPTCRKPLEHADIEHIAHAGDNFERDVAAYDEIVRQEEAAAAAQSGASAHEASAAWVERNAKPCPLCLQPIQKDGGCLFMRCETCGLGFCYKCYGAHHRMTEEECENDERRLNPADGPMPLLPGFVQIGRCRINIENDSEILQHVMPFWQRGEGCNIAVVTCTHNDYARSSWVALDTITAQLSAGNASHPSFHDTYKPITDIQVFTITKPEELAVDEFFMATAEEFVRATISPNDDATADLHERLHQAQEIQQRPIPTHVTDIEQIAHRYYEAPARPEERFADDDGDEQELSGTLWLTNAGISEIDAHVFEQMVERFPNLRTIDFSDNPIESLSEEIFELPEESFANLRTLNFSRTPLARSPEWRRIHERLELENMRVLPEIPIPAHITDIEQIAHLYQENERNGADAAGHEIPLEPERILNLNDSRITEIDGTVFGQIAQRFPHLETLCLAEAGILDLPDEIAQLRGLKNLYLDIAPITQRPDWPDVRQHLKELLPGCCIIPAKKLPEHVTIANFDDLLDRYEPEFKSFSITQPHIQHIDGEVFQALADRFPEMKHLNFIGTGLQELPDQVGLLRNLQALDLSGSALVGNGENPEWRAIYEHLQELLPRCYIYPAPVAPAPAAE